MPVHSFRSPDGKETSILVSIHADVHEHQVQIIDGVEWKRVYDGAPLAAIDTRVGDATRADFRKITEKRGITIGEMQDEAAAMAAHREEKQGQDPVTERYYANYEKEMGDKHANVKIREANKRLEGYGIKIKAKKPGKA